MGAIEREITVPATPSEVWPAVTHSDEISAWFGAEAEIHAQPGGRGTFRWPDGRSHHILVEEVEPECRLAFRWLPFERTAAGEIRPVPSTRVEITLDEVADGTRVRVVEREAFSSRALRARSGGQALALVGA